MISMWKRVLISTVSFIAAIPSTVYTYVQRLQPSRVVSVKYCDTTSNTVSCVYDATHTWTPSWPKSFTANMFLPNEKGYFIFTVWNAWDATYEHIILNRKHVCEAFSIKYPSALWAFSDIGIVYSLTSYIKMLSRQSADFHLFAVMLKGKDISEHIHPYMKSIVIPDNITPKALQLLYMSIVGDQSYDDKADIVFIDYELHEHRYEANTYIVTS